MQYAQELKEYQQTEAFHITSAKIHDKKIKKGNSRSQILKAFICALKKTCIMLISFSFLFFQKTVHQLLSVLAQDRL